MRLLSAIGVSVLALAIVVPAYAQDKPDQKEEEKDKPAKENEKKEQPAKPVKQQEEKNQPQEKNNKQEEKSTQQQEKNNQQEQRDTQQQTRNNQQEQKNVQHGRIPDDRYKANFGREHTFRVSQGDFRSGRFQYGGYWFGFGGAWPSNWLYTQDVYVIEIDGVYYLCNPAYPGVNLLINVTL